MIFTLQAPYYWLIGMVIFGIIEGIIPGLVSIWCAVAAAFTAIFSIFVKNTMYQVYFFLILSVILFIITRKFSKKILEGRKNSTERVNRIIGSIVEIKKVNKNGSYDIYLDGKYWTGISDTKFFVGDKAKVEKISGIKLVLGKTDIKVEVE